eukprot:m.66503 g.66503  ORF g.66503 m.66503 type:complete len:349 (+) comp14050_c0_seq1:93-1139(+)
MTELTPAQRNEARRGFNLLDSDNDGRITKDEFESAVRETSFKSAPAEEIIRQADVNDDGAVTFDEFLDALTYQTNAKGESTGSFNMFVRLVQRTHVAQNKTHELDYLDQYKCWPPPFVIICMTIIEIGVFIHYSDVNCDNSPDLECPVVFTSHAAFRPGCREEVWRFYTYIFVHNGIMHILFNMIIQILLGIPLEMVHGPWRVFLLYSLGAIAGSFASSVFDPNSNLVGASGAVYALIGAHVSDVIVNWGEMPFREVRAAVLFLLVAADFSVSIYNRYYKDDTSVSYCGHMAGFVMGCTMGTWILRNLKLTRAEVYLKWIGLAIAGIGVIFAFFWNIFYDYKYDTCPT